MAEAPDYIDKLLTDVRKTICDNRQFLEKLANEAIEVDSDDDAESAALAEDFEEL